jgi:ABC-type polysaccharide/polyol phosphate transport system ATPase subunit
VAAEGSPIIGVSGLGKKFKLYARPWDRLAEWIGRRSKHQDFWALKDVSFTVARGESLGVIGVNGSGKSTLLKILTGAMYPTEGRFNVQGRVLSLLELGTGVSPELTGRQNVVNASRLLAFPDDYAQAKMADIEAFADLPAGFFDHPVKLYSSGMLVRLVFSMFACFDPDVFIVDEALSVGDVFFQQKCARRLQDMKAAGVTLLFVSHDLAAVEALCDRVLLLHRGQTRHLGDKVTGIRMYYAMGEGRQEDKETRRQGGGETGRHSDSEAAKQGGNEAARPGEGGNAGSLSLSPGLLVSLSDPSLSSSLPWQMPDEHGALGDGRVRITGLCYRGPSGAAEPVVRQGEWLDVFVRLKAEQDADAVNGGLSIYDRFDRLLFARGWLNAEVSPVSLRAGQEVIQRFRIKLDLEPGEYILALAAAQAIRRADAPGGWDQEGGGDRYVELKRAGKIAVLPRADKRRLFYGPSPLESEISRMIIETPNHAAHMKPGKAAELEGAGHAG